MFDASHSAYHRKSENAPLTHQMAAMNESHTDKYHINAKSWEPLDYATRNQSDSFNFSFIAFNGSAPENSINSFYFYETIQFTVLWIMFFSIVLGNSAVLAALFLNNSRKSRMNYFIMQLAFADLLVGLISVLTDIVWRISISWKAGLIACKIIRFLQAVVTYSSTYVLVALSIDRFDAITRPMNFSGSWRRARILIGSAWMISVLFSSPIIVLYEEKVIQGKTQCWIELEPWQWKVYMTLVAITVFLIPAIIITACYTIIVYTIWTKSKTLSPVKRLDNNKPHEDHDIRRSSSRGIIPRAKIKTVKMTFVIVFVFILCWSPYIVFDLLQVYGYIPTTQTNIAIATFIQSLAPLNSAANPVIYCLFSTHICNSLSKVPPFSWVTCCNQQSQEPSSCTETLTSSSNRQRSMSTLRTNNNVRSRPHNFEFNHHDALL
ncbi:cardioacceleratory peptide receptor-like isoform X2 [Planococcus citri]|uniref:cardioacceleratory peptide receptor-like isoform X2 n=1 Tax=Planococcus citri TaxID=170843 RepID=UPI0031F9EA8F